MDEYEAYSRFMKVYDELCEKYKLKCHVEHVRNGQRDWYRLQVFGHQEAYGNIDTQWVFVEKISRKILYLVASDMLLAAEERWKNAK